MTSMDDSDLRILCHGSTRINPDNPNRRSLIREDPWRMLLRRSSGKRQQGDVAGLLDGRRQTVLVRRAYAGQAPRNDLAALSDELAEHAVILVVDVLDFLDAELANFLAPEKLSPPAAFARRTAGTASATTAAKPRTISTWTISPGSGAFAGTRPFARSRLFWCFRFFSHNSPRISSVCQMSFSSCPRFFAISAIPGHPRRSKTFDRGVRRDCREARREMREPPY